MAGRCACADGGVCPPESPESCVCFDGWYGEGNGAGIGSLLACGDSTADYVRVCMWPSVCRYGDRCQWQIELTLPEDIQLVGCEEKYAGAWVHLDVVLSESLTPPSIEWCENARNATHILRNYCYGMLYYAPIPTTPNPHPGPTTERC